MTTTSQTDQTKQRPRQTDETSIPGGRVVLMGFGDRPGLAEAFERELVKRVAREEPKDRRGQAVVDAVLASDDPWNYDLSIFNVGDVTAARDAIKGSLGDGPGAGRSRCELGRLLAWLDAELSMRPIYAMVDAMLALDDPTDYDLSGVGMLDLRRAASHVGGRKVSGDTSERLAKVTHAIYAGIARVRVDRDKSVVVPS